MNDFFENIAIGADIENISRFDNKSLENDKDFLSKIYTQRELEYCFERAKPSQHLAVRYCAKEAIVKALSSFNTVNVAYNEIEILNTPNGVPYINLINYNDKFIIKVSLSHCNDTATAFVIVKIML